MEDRLKKILLPAVFLAASASFTLTGQSCSMPKGNTQPDTIVRAEFVDSSDVFITIEQPKLIRNIRV